MICLAPLAGVTSMPVREFFSRLGAELTHTEMISCAGIIRDNKRTLTMFEKSPLENELVIQFFSAEPQSVTQAVEIVLNHEKNYHALGFNMACPMPKVTKNGAGAALLLKPEIAVEITKALKQFNYPVWLKIRKLKNDNDTLKFVELMLNAGADNICIHGRTREQRYEGQADKNILKLAAKNFPGHISASGDVKTLDDINEYSSYGCNPVMIARAAISNAWIFKELNGCAINYAERVTDLKALAARTLELYGEHVATITVKHFIPSLFHDFNGAAEYRNKAYQATNLEDMFKIFESVNYY